MCLIGLAIEPPGPWLFVVAANRDEFHDRLTASAAYWEGSRTGLLAGRDLQGGGTWLGLRRCDGDTTLRFGALTNIRPGLLPLSAAQQAGEAAATPSRGVLVSSFLAGDVDPASFLSRLEPPASTFAGFNLLAARLGRDAEAGAWYLNNLHGKDSAAPRRLGPGIHVLSNDRLGVVWPKTRLLHASLTHVLEAHRHEPGWSVSMQSGAGPSAGASADTSASAGRAARLGVALLEVLADRTTAQEADLPDTGLDRDRERLLSAPFIVDDHYGTRCSTVLVVARDGEVCFVERSFGPGGRLLGTVVERFLLRIPRVCNQLA